MTSKTEASSVTILSAGQLDLQSYRLVIQDGELFQIGKRYL
jgi:predicted component of type VI protein secretion system